MRARDTDATRTLTFCREEAERGAPLLRPAIWMTDGQHSLLFSSPLSSLQLGGGFTENLSSMESQRRLCGQ
ncbi:hypothetical protein OJAV_G00004530 [Oryzias javanicus]|uniref:Uncharacterized protein n=1 Tax=Oryzias javanicus TaxID=123683 RepID=A0A3S2PTR2_ORYJA|nr:hypothetical protein OJAV_G00004530 [Oryzias javanicus]